MSERLELESGESVSSSIPLSSVLTLSQAAEPHDVYDWAITLASERIDADFVELAIISNELLIPAASTAPERRGREHTIPIATSIPGSVVTTGDGCIIDDRQDARGDVRAGNGNQAFASVDYRSLVCAPIPGIGVMCGKARRPSAFEQEDLNQLDAIAAIIANMVKMLEGGRGERIDPLLEEIGNLVSHDLRNKLNIATGRLDLAIKTDDEDQLQQSVEALESVERIADVVVSLARTGKPLSGLEEVDLEGAIEGAFGPLGEPDAVLTVKASATILADPDCLSQLLENLFRNAIEHSDGEVRIEVGLLEDGFYVSDNGPGIPPDIREDVCQLGYSTAPGHQGKGLSIVSRMAEAHGWTMKITDSTNGGARIELRNVVFQSNLGA